MPMRSGNKSTSMAITKEKIRKIEHTYEKGDKILSAIAEMKLRKLAKPRQGPYRVVKVSKNGTIKFNCALVLLTLLISECATRSMK